MKNGKPNAQQSKLRHKPNGQQDRSDPLHKQCAQQGVAHHSHHSGYPVQVHGRGHHQALRQADTPVQSKGDDGDQGNKPQSA